ncbi:type IV pilus assembly protein PilE [Mucilaginibacter sp. UYP25]|uniref:type IV pilin protein n=1 Tax=unclassified Mucilaginibacter TaxID=2617802 RepID=UPI003395F5C4
MKPKHNLFKKKVDAFTLTELLVVLAIIGILVTLLTPSMLKFITKAKNVEAKTQLAYLQTLEQSYYFEHSRYSNDLIELGYEQGKLVSDGKDGRANYRIEIVRADNTSFTARAVSVTDFNGNGKFNIWEVDQDRNIKEVIPD